MTIPLSLINSAAPSLAPISGFWKFTHLDQRSILQNHSVNMLSTVNTSPSPRMLGFAINLFINHVAATAIAFWGYFLHPPTLWERESLIRIVGSKIPGLTILSIIKIGLPKPSFEDYRLKVRILICTPGLYFCRAGRGLRVSAAPVEAKQRSSLRRHSRRKCGAFLVLAALAR